MVRWVSAVVAVNAVSEQKRMSSQRHASSYTGTNQSLGGHGAGTKSVWDLNNFCPLS